MLMPVTSAPDDHFTAGPDCRVIDRAAGALVVLVAVQLSVPGLYLPPVLKEPLLVVSAPDDHFTAGPDCRVTVSCRGRVGGAGGCPTIRAGIVSPPVFEGAECRIHPKRSFHCRSRLPCDISRPRARWWCWWRSNYRCWDCISRRYSRELPSYVHPKRSFHCRSRLPCDVAARGRISGAGGGPGIIGARASPASAISGRV